ncbi:MAG: DNA cytosine methyltransferase [Hyphomicrobiaceae bacterium]
MKPAYYNEHDPFAAAWLRELITAGAIAEGEVDERSILDVRPADLDGFRQCHFFAGIGVWSHALRAAGWADDRPVWTGSCPCQPLSGAGQRKGHADERHLWPALYALVAECRPAVVFGEQVTGQDGREWFAAVRTDLEGTGYAVGAADLCAAGAGAPHIRQRLYFVAMADAEYAGLEGRLSRRADARRHDLDRHARRDGATGGLGYADRTEREAWSDIASGSETRPGESAQSGAPGGLDHTAGARLEGTFPEAEGDPQGKARLRLPDAGRGNGGLADTAGCRHPDEPGQEPAGLQPPPPEDPQGPESGRHGAGPRTGGSGPSDGFWRNADWLFCRDGVWRPVEPGSFPLAHGAAARVGRLRGYGNALCAPVAQSFIEAVMA